MFCTNDSYGALLVLSDNNTPLMQNDTYNIIRHGSIHVRQGLLLKLSVATYLATVI